MSNVPAYDTEVELINKVADANEVTTAEVIEALCDFIEEVKADRDWV